MIRRAVLSLLAGCALAAAFGEYGFQYLRLGYGSRPTALGEAYAGVFGDISGLTYNPAAIATASQSQFTTSYGRWLAGTHLGQAAFATGLGPVGRLGIGVRGLYAGGIQGRDSVGNATGDLAAFFWDPSLTLARAFGRFSVGLTGRLVMAGIGAARSQGVAFGLGLGYAHPSFGIGVALDDIGRGIRLLDGTSQLPAQARLGAAFHHFEPLLATCDITAGIGVAPALHAGLEYSPVHAVAFRVGYQTDRLGAGTAAGLTAGIGLRISGLSVDYTFVPVGDLGLTHRVGFIYNLGFDEASRRKIEAEARARERAAMEEKEKLMSTTYTNQGLTLYRQSRYDDAVAAWDLALIWNPENTVAQTWIDRASTEKRKKEIADLRAQADSALAHRNYVEAIAAVDSLLVLDTKDSLAQAFKNRASEEFARYLARRTRQTGSVDLLQAGTREFARGRYPEAIALWQKVLNADPTNRPAADYIKKARARIEERLASGIRRVDEYVKAGRWERASLELTALLRLAPKNDSLLRRRAEVSRRRNEEIARELAAGRISLAQESLSQAESHYRTVLRYDSANEQAKSGLAQVEKARTRTPKAARDKDYLYLRGIEAYTQDNYVQAIAFWQQVLAIDPGYTKAAKNIERAQRKLALVSR